MATTVRTTPAASGDVTFMTPRKKWFKVGMRAPIMLGDESRYRCGVVSSVVDQNRVVIWIDGEQHRGERVPRKNRFDEEGLEQ